MGCLPSKIAETMSGERNARRRFLAHHFWVQIIGLGELFDGLMRSISKCLDPDMRANDGLDQSLIARIFWYENAFDRSCNILRHIIIPGDFDLSAGAVYVAASSRRYPQLIAGNNDVLKHFNEVRAIRESCRFLT